ncbi:hypothetical protein HOD30_02390 [Candidatus Peregrinibacteria bacterium]|nr:hypothetical protein [Candidatus Peregrinibacteria bacterium]MBT4631840.1 hypothetical protein [Candidatus Peregrinibacteria bacterium]MBT5516342.1 hypothetical protein [Candidatus Peregrinibacteria bacterium]
MNFPSIKKVGLSLAIVISLNVFFSVGIETFYPSPEYNDFCGEKGRVVEDHIVIDGDVDVSQGCSDLYHESRELYARNAFVLYTALGVISVAAGLFLTVPSAVLGGFLYGGVITLFIGTTQYWSYMEDYLQFIVSGIALVIFVGIGIKKLKD